MDLPRPHVIPRLALLLLLTLLAGCSTNPPRLVTNSCAIFEEKDDWYDYAAESSEKWGVPIHIQLAFIHQESRFLHDAQPPRTKLLWIIPWKRKSSAYDYAQVKDETWEWYQKATGNSGADRDDFEDAVDFIGWYVNLTHKKLGISKWDAYNQYLAYHEGHGGYRARSFDKKPWLIKVARKVEQQAKKYGAQLKACEEELKSRWSFWPF